MFTNVLKRGISKKVPLPSDWIKAAEKEFKAPAISGDELIWKTSEVLTLTQIRMFTVMITCAFLGNFCKTNLYRKRLGRSAS